MGGVPAPEKIINTQGTKQMISERDEWVRKRLFESVSTDYSLTESTNIYDTPENLLCTTDQKFRECRIRKVSFDGIFVQYVDCRTGY